MERDFPIRLSWVGVALGLLAGGPLGALIGWFVGRKLDKRQERRRLLAENRGLRREAVAAAVVVLGAKMAKADGQVSAAEVRAFKETFRIPADQEGRVAELWDEARRTPGGYEPQAWQLTQAYRHRPVMLERIYAVLHRVARADGDGIRPEERRFLDDVARIFRLRDLEPAPDALDLDGPAEMAEVEAALYELFRPGAARRKPLDRMLDWLEAANARWSVALDRRRGRLLASPLTRPLGALGAGGLAAVVAHAFLPAGLMPPFPYSDLVWAGLAGLVAGGLVFAVLPAPPRLQDQLADTARKAGLDPDELAGAIADAEARVAALRRVAEGLEESLRRRVDGICAAASQIIEGLREDPGDLRRVRRFLGHYLVATEDLVGRYATLLGKEAESRRLQAVAAKVEPVLGEIEAAFRKRYQRTLDDDALELDVQLDVVRRSLRTEAL